MRALSLLCIATLCAACASPRASAAEPGQDDAVEVIQTCLAARTDIDAKPEECVGQVSRTCGERQGEGAATTVGVVICATSEAEAWRSVLNANAATLRARESETQAALLDRALAAGEQWARDRCAYDASYYEGGSLARVLGAQCARDTTALRAIDLHRRLHAEP
jgi:hypothetical protein